MTAIADLLGSTKRWVVQVTLATHRHPTDASLEAMADHANTFGMGMARTLTSGVIFSVEVVGVEIQNVPEWAFAVTKAAGYEPTAAWLADLRIIAPEAYEAEALQPDTVRAPARWRGGTRVGRPSRG